jgi:hypothetical protein
MKFHAKLQKPKLNASKYRDALRKVLNEALAQAALVWIETTAEAVIPVWSGASRATFLALADKIDCLVTIQPVVADRISLGTEYGTATFDPGTTPGVYSFSYVSTLPHLHINENYDARVWGFHLANPGPYHFQAQGRQALREYVSSIVYPGLASFLELSPSEV